MDKDIYKLDPGDFPALIKEIPDQPENLYMMGEYPNQHKNKFLCVVGSRKYSDYGKQITEELMSGLRGCNVVIISGLALGIDSIAHRAALNAGLSTVAIPGSGLAKSVLYPRTNVGLAEKILESGGALVSEFEPDFKATVWSFPQRNRIMAGLSDAVLVIEAGEKSGTLITSRLAGEYNRDVFTVPGSIFNSGSAGPHMLIRLGATPITSSDDILDALGIDRVKDRHSNTAKLFESLSKEEHLVINLLEAPKSRDEIIVALGMPVHKANVVLSSLEIKGVIEEKLGQIRIK